MQSGKCNLKLEITMLMIYTINQNNHIKINEEV